MNEMTLGHGNSPQYYIFTSEKHFVFRKLECQNGVRTRHLRLPKQAALTTAPGPLPGHLVGL